MFGIFYRKAHKGLIKIKSYKKRRVRKAVIDEALRTLRFFTTIYIKKT